MADLVVGLASSVVKVALSKAHGVLDEEELNLRQRMARDLVMLAVHLERMQSFLNVSKQEEVVTSWAIKVRDLAYDVEDFVDGLAVSLENRPTWWRRMLPSCTAAWKLPLDLAAAEMMLLRSRGAEVRASYSFSSTKTGTEATALEILLDAREATRRQGFADLTQLITRKDDGHHVVAVWGTGGDLGTTSAMRKAYNDPPIFQKFNCRAWVKLVHLFSPYEFIRELTAQFYASSEELNHEAITGFLAISEGEGDYLEEFLRHMKEVKYLIVLEDLSSLAEWGAIRKILPHTNNGSWIIVSTQQFEVATVCVGHPFKALELKRFSTEHSVCALGQGSQSDGDKAEEISETHEVPEVILTYKSRAASDWMMKYPIIGREFEIRDLLECTVKAYIDCSRRISVWGIRISVWGMAGVGKSALVRNLFCNRTTLPMPFQKYGWVDVSHPFNLRDLCRSLILDFHSESLHDNGMIRIKNPIQECREFVEEHCCLLVIDDLHSREEWDLIESAFLSGSSRSIAIVITTEESIATYCVHNEELVFNVKSLQPDAAIEVFHQAANRKNPLSPLKDLIEDTKLLELILKCGGLPKVIVEVAGILAEKTETLMDTIRSTSDRFMQTLETNPEYHSLRSFFGWMYSYFRYCPYALKPCILYMSVFSRDLSIRRRRVVRRWVAEGYSRNSEINSAEQNGEMFFARLLDLSIIQHPRHFRTTLFGETRNTLCQLNGFIHEYIISLAEKNSVSELGTNCNLITQRAVRHLIIRENWQRDPIVFWDIDFSRLRSLTVYGRWESFFICNSMKFLRVLDLEDASGVQDEDLKAMVKLLHGLKFLSLRGCRDIYSLPSSLGDLRQLQTLDIRNTPIVSLPATITKLQKLQYIRAGTSVTGEELSTQRILLSRFHRHRSKVGVQVPGGIYKLTSLSTFGVVNISESGATTILKELKYLKQLRKLGVSGINRKNSHMFFSAISGHIHLESLSVQLDKESQGCLAGISLTSRNLQSLKLHGPVESLPDLHQLSKLAKLDLEMTMLGSAYIALIGQLPELCVLRVKLLQDSSLHFCVLLEGLELCSYQKVKVLEVASTSNVHVTFGAETMLNLELLKAHCSNGSSMRFSGLHNLFELKEMLLKGFSDELEEEVKNQLLQIPNSPVLKLEK